ncbi:MAG: efflux transporter periplasmic adaptor subunit, partial [Muribaculaceae bacterium]|nr:efflux transporter periplasmic adaptor subunit [Muribaculaceae bacterium]
VIQATSDNDSHDLRSGMYCTVRMPYKVDPEALLIRDASIGTDQLGKYVYLVNDSSKIVYTPIKTGDLVADTLRIVTEGLRPGDRYVTSALLKVHDGMKVKAVPQ